VGALLTPPSLGGADLTLPLVSRALCVRAEVDQRLSVGAHDIDRSTSARGPADRTRQASRRVHAHGRTGFIGCCRGRRVIRRLARELVIGTAGP
jgi:hypothetical protein